MRTGLIASGAFLLSYSAKQIWGMWGYGLIIGACLIGMGFCFPNKNEDSK